MVTDSLLSSFLFLEVLVQDAAGADDETTSLGAQNEVLKIALEDSRKDLQAMAAQVCCRF